MYVLCYKDIECWIYVEETIHKQILIHESDVD